MKMSREMEVAVSAAREAGRVLMSHYGNAKIERKADRSLVTQADIEAEEAIRSLLGREFPGHSFLGEESGLEERGSDFVWVVDPLDGTTNYTIRNPFFCTAIALTYRGEPVLGVVYNPHQDELFRAEKGRGAYLNGQKLEVSPKEELGDSVVTFCHSRTREGVERIGGIFAAVKTATNKFRQLGASNLELCYVASGRTQGHMVPDVNTWDVAAGVVVVREAGGEVTDFRGRPYTLASRDILATNGRIHGRLLELLSGR
ncbi:MAG: inositol monophosphatase [Euryarchaeota archaeon]|nr:inositol monophosphatase [Euryarchaeota archaeon]